ncbi:MAG: hypothetical protein JWN21_2214 [Sphingomonas bacterium]|uniref:hypothetical protein n=1 Tax=Sphingomonas bacterium TaxID=1895847 RepID=UPI00262CF04F|nr:hypothetical protein [Sphingomonas bacterium]MDB5696671.1 hypothetical protein [Sphingomonas bacterium]
MFRLALIFAISAAMPAAAQRANSPIALPDASSSDDIIVRGLRIPREKLPTGVYWDYQSIVPSRIARENADMFLRCALKSSDVAWVRKVVDGEPNSAEARFAQGWIVETHPGCYPPQRSTRYVTTPVPTATTEVGEARLDRGVIVEMVLKSYATEAELTEAITADPKVQSRFQQREGIRNRLRLPDDRAALAFASCLVMREPVLATRLFRSEPGSLLERGLTQTIIVEGRECVGRSGRVTIDPSFARVYIIDAFYRWVVAARGTDSLIPADA